MKTDLIIEKLQRNMIGGVVITGPEGEVYRDGNVQMTQHFIDQAREACPAKDKAGSVNTVILPTLSTYSKNFKVSGFLPS